MVQVLSLTIFALLAARVLRAPRGSWRLIVGAAVLVLFATQLLPAGHPLRADVAESSRSLFWVALALAPVVGYALLIRHLRRRSGADLPEAAPPRPVGLVQIPDDAALLAETRAALDRGAAEATGTAPETLSLGWRAADGELAGHLRMRLVAASAEIEVLHVGAEYRRAGIGTALVTAAAAEARARGAERLWAVVADWQTPGFFAGLDFRTLAEAAGAQPRRWMERPLA